MKISDLSAEHRRYLRTETAVNSIVNAAFSALFAWLFFRSANTIPLWGAMGMAVDLIPTVFMCTLVTGLIATTMTRKKVRQGVLHRLSSAWLNYMLIRMWPRNVVLRSILLALLATLALVPVSVGVMLGLNVMEMNFMPLLIFKVVYGGAVTALAAPGFLIAALTDDLGQTVTAAAV